MPTGVYLRTPEMNAERGKKISEGKKAADFHFTEESKQKMREAALGREIPDAVRQKISKTLTGFKRPILSQERITTYGYVLTYQPGIGYVKRANLVMEQMLGRPLLPEEVVHHKNKVPSDDRPENLQLFPNESEHKRHHCLAGDYWPLKEEAKGETK